MKKKVFFILFAVSFLCWLLPFIIRLFFIEMPIINYENTQIPATIKNNEVEELLHLISINDRWSVFISIFKNNIKGCFYNILGGFLLGLGTFYNLLINGFYSADVFANSYNSGVSLERILNVTLPHSFELAGFWLSGAMGFSIARIIIRFMKGKENLPPHFLKQMCACAIIVFILILAAAYVEAYVSIL